MEPDGNSTSNSGSENDSEVDSEWSESLEEGDPDDLLDWFTHSDAEDDSQVQPSLVRQCDVVIETPS